MTPLVIHPQEEITPGVTLDQAKGAFEITGWSHPEDAFSFYTPVLEWLNNYSENPNADTIFSFQFQYFNTASAKQIFKIIHLLEEVSKKSKTKIYWHHDADDTDMLVSGRRFSKMSTVPFEFISH